MKKKVFKRLYDFCIEDDSKPPYPRGYLFRKHRVPFGVLMFLIHVPALVLIVLPLGFNRLLIIPVLLSTFLYMFYSRMGPFSFYYLYNLKSISQNTNRSIFEAFILETNYEKNEIHLNLENRIHSREHFSWLKSTLVFRDKKLHNIHQFTISLQGVKYSCKLSKKCKQMMKHMKIKSKIKNEFFNKDFFKDCHSIKELQTEIHKLYLSKRDAMNKITNMD